MQAEEEGGQSWSLGKEEGKGLDSPSVTARLCFSETCLTASTKLLPPASCKAEPSSSVREVRQAGGRVWQQREGG